jgi:hypothetical protein
MMNYMMTTTAHLWTVLVCERAPKLALVLFSAILLCSNNLDCSQADVAENTRLIVTARETGSGRTREVTSLMADGGYGRLTRWLDQNPVTVRTLNDM